MINKQELWPKEGKLKKGLIIFGIVVVGALLITLLEEKTKIKAGSKLPFIIALACIGVWVYQPAEKKETGHE